MYASIMMMEDPSLICLRPPNFSTKSSTCSVAPCTSCNQWQTTFQSQAQQLAFRFLGRSGLSVTAPSTALHCIPQPAFFSHPVSLFWERQRAFAEAFAEMSARLMYSLSERLTRVKGSRMAFFLVADRLGLPCSLISSRLLMSISSVLGSLDSPSTAPEGLTDFTPKAPPARGGPIKKG